MVISHIALLVTDLEKIKDFYVLYFGAVAGNKYSNQKTGLESYFLSFTDGAKLELMHYPDCVAQSHTNISNGYIHMAISVGSKQAVDTITDQLRCAGCTIIGEPRITGDGYYESVVSDPEGNYIEITV